MSFTEDESKDGEGTYFPVAANSALTLNASIKRIYMHYSGKLKVSTKTSDICKDCYLYKNISQIIKVIACNLTFRNFAKYLQLAR